MLLGVLLSSLGVLAHAAADPAALHPFWPRFPAPKTLVRMAPHASTDEAFTAQTLAGLVARRARKGGPAEYVWLPTDHPAYRRWSRAMRASTRAREEGPVKLWELVARYREAGLVKGYVLYRPDTAPRGAHQAGTLDVSVNVATTVCGPLQAIAVSEREEARAKEQGLSRLFDARGVTEAECFDRYRERLERRIALQDPKVPNIRAEAIALGAFTLSGPGPLYERALQWAEADTPILGWGVGDEREITSPVSRWGQFITATDWCQNLPPLAHRPGPALPPEKLRRPAARSLWDLPWERDVHYAAFVMSDGDNVQWLMGDFMDGRERSWWGSPDRGRATLGWTTCYADLAQLCPYSLAHLFATATPKDDFLLFSGGYYYPDEFGANRKDPTLLRRHASRLAGYMRQGGLNLLAMNMQRWDSPAARQAYRTYAESIPGLLGMFPVQYAPYAAGKGRVIWAPDGKGGEVPALSPRFALWGGSSYEQDGSPGRVAELLNRQAYRGEPVNENHFSWVVVHCWSWFRRRAPGQPASAEELDQSRGGAPGTARGVSPVRWCQEALEPHVRVVTPTELALLLRLRLHPKETLTRALDELDAVTPARQTVIEARRLLAKGDYAGAFAAGKRGYRAVE